MTFNFENYLNKTVADPQWLKDERANAWKKYTELAMPLEAEEGWRLLDFNTIDFENLDKNLEHVVESKSAQNAAVAKSSTTKLSNPDDCLWHKEISQFVNHAAGVLIVSPQGMWSHLDQEILDQGVVFMPLAQALEKNADLLKPYIEQSAALETSSANNKFALLNRALCPGSAGMVIYVPDNVRIEKPLLCLNLFKQDDAAFAMSRLLIVVGKRAKLDVINVLATDEITLKATDSKKLPITNYLTQAYLKAEGQLNYAEVQNFDDHNFVINHSDFIIEENSRLHNLIAAFGAGQLKGETRTILKGRGAESTLNGVVLGNKNERYNFNTIEDHDAPDTKSSINFRVALKDEAQSMYLGTIKVAENAAKTDAYQSNKNLLLNEGAHADSIPKLEILTDDVKCSHGATVGPVDKKQIFYLMSRGLSESKAEELIVNGFFHQLLNDCPIAGVVDWLDSLVANKIEFGSAHVHNVQKKAAKQLALTR